MGWAIEMDSINRLHIKQSRADPLWQNVLISPLGIGQFLLDACSSLPNPLHWVGHLACEKSFSCYSQSFLLGSQCTFSSEISWKHNKNHMLYLVRCFYKRQCIQVMVWECTSQKFTSEWYDEISYFSVCSKADINELNLPHGRWVINVWSSLPHNVDFMSLLYLYPAVFTARCYASAVLAMGLCLCPSVCPSVCHKSEFY